MSAIRFISLVPKLRLGTPVEKLRFESIHRREAELLDLRSQAELRNEGSADGLTAAASATTLHPPCIVGATIMPRSILLTVPMSLLLVLLGCGGPKKEYKYRVAVIPKGLTHQFWQSIHRGAERAADDLAKQGISVEIIWAGPRTEDDAQAQIT